MTPSNKTQSEAEFANSERKARVAHKVAVTSRISETSRFVGFGIVAWVFAVHTSDAVFATKYIASYELWVNVAGFLGMLAIVFDYLQYLCAYLSVKHSLTRKDNFFQFDKNHPSYLLQSVFFGAKQVCAIVSSIIISITFGMSVVLD
ncbi:hypothetical protein [Pseudophaeobacter arcticus]|uniref:hypothetical protein n=1 Tax=Pseudophaeobacter arcticus TaxID=385492 RepID=UPI0039E66BBE